MIFVAAVINSLSSNTNVGYKSRVKMEAENFLLASFSRQYLSGGNSGVDLRVRGPSGN